MRLDILGPWSGALLGAAFALLVALLARATGRGALSGLAAPIGIAVGWAMTIGLVIASPRQIVERLPALAVASLPLGLLAGLVATRPALVWTVTGLGALGCGWWMAGAPLHGPDLLRAAPTAAMVAGGTILAAVLLQTAWQPVAASLALALALSLSTLRGPQDALAIVAAAAVVAAGLGGTAPSPAMRVPLAVMLAALAAIPPMVRGTLPDWMIAATAPLAILLAPLVARRLPPETAQILAALIVAAPLLIAIAWLAGQLG